MWCLAGGTTKFFFVSKRKQEYSVGRLGGLDMSVDEASVSRSHASLFLQEDGSLYLMDKSKFGTKVNNVRLAANVMTKLNHGDQVMIGVSRSFVVSHLPLAICLLPNDASLAAKMEGLTLVNDVRLCSHVVMTRPAILPKMLLALVLQKHVVAAAWLEAVLQRKIASDPFPNEALYSAPLPEGSSLPNTARAELFRNCYFCYPSEKSFTQLSPLCLQAGAAAVFSPGQLPPTSASSRVLLVMPADNDLEGDVIKNLAVLQSRNLPFVTAESIAMAVLKSEFEFPELESFAEGSLGSAAATPPRNEPSAKEVSVSKHDEKKRKEELAKQEDVKSEHAGQRNFKRFKKQPLAASKHQNAALFSRDKMVVQGSSSQSWASQVEQTKLEEEKEERAKALAWDLSYVSKK
jgi:hypothetical protein